jgi:hypothetical protein
VTAAEFVGAVVGTAVLLLLLAGPVLMAAYTDRQQRRRRAGRRYRRLCHQCGRSVWADQACTLEHPDLPYPLDFCSPDHLNRYMRSR